MVKVGSRCLALANAAGDDVDIRLRALRRDAGLKASHQVIVFVAILVGGGTEGQARKDIHFGDPAHGRHDLAVQQEIGAQDAGHGEGRAADQDGPSEDVGVAAKEALPTFVAEDGDIGAAGNVLGRSEEAAEKRLGAEQREEIGRGSEDAARSGRSRPVRVAVAAVRDRDRFEGVVLRHDVGVLAGRGPVPRDAQAGRAEPQFNEAIGLRIGQRLEEKSIDDTENSRVGPDADGEGKHDYEGKARSFPHGAESVTNVGKQRTHGH